MRKSTGVPFQGEKPPLGGRDRYRTTGKVYLVASGDDTGFLDTDTTAI